MISNDDVQMPSTASPSIDMPNLRRLPPQHARRVRLVVIAASLGTVIEYFDFTVYAFLATTIAAVFFPAEQPGNGLLYALAVFGVAFVVRPIGGILIGHLGDRHGRKPALAVSVLGMALASVLIGLLPTYSSIGIWAPVLLFALRCLQGLSAGGELGGAAAYVAEVAPDEQRGFLTSMTQVGTLVGTMLGSLGAAILHLSITTPDLLAWGWRIPFLVSLPLGVGAFLVRMRLEESTQFERVERTGALAKLPALSALKSHRRGVVAVFGLSLGTFAAYYLVFTYAATYFEQQGIMSPSAAAGSTTLTLALAAVTIPFWGRMADRWGRRPVLIGACLLDVVLAYPAFLGMRTSPLVAVLAQLALGLIEAGYLGVILATYCEQFPAPIRSSGFSLGYNAASVLAGGMAPYVATWLIRSTGQPQAPAWILIATASLSLLTALSLKESARQPMPVT